MVNRSVIARGSTNAAKILKNASDELAAMGVKVDGVRDITKKIGARRTIKLKFKNFLKKIVKHIEKTPDW